MYTTILTLYKQGNSQREIAKLTGHDRKTVRRVVSKYNSAGVESPTLRQRESKSFKWHEEIVKLLEGHHPKPEGILKFIQRINPLNA